jgi:KRAB domain-containing zinc finger protein
LEKGKGFYSLNLDDYVVDCVESGKSESASQSTDDPRPEGEVGVAVKLEKSGEELGNPTQPLSNPQGESIMPISSEASNIAKDEKGSVEQLDNAKVYGCVYCDYTGRKQNWLIHIRSKHKDKKIFFCSRHRVCAMPFNSQELLDRHTELAHKQEHICPTCNKIYRYPSQLTKHMQIHLSDDSEDKRKHICPYCGKKFSTRSGYRSHEAHYHTLDLRHKCDWEGCTKAYFSLNDLKIHKRGHTGELPFTCSYCGTGFVAKCRLVQHEKVIHLRIGKQASCNFFAL